MKQDYTMYIYKRDRRCKTGERLMSITAWSGRTEAGMRRECNELYDLYPATQGWRFECVPHRELEKDLTGW